MEDFIIENMEILEDKKLYREKLKIERLSFDIGDNIGILDRDNIYSEEFFKIMMGINQYTGSLKIFNREFSKFREEILYRMGMYYDGSLDMSRKLGRVLELSGSYYRNVSKPRIEDLISKYRFSNIRQKRLNQLDLFTIRKLGIAIANLNYPDIYIFYNILSELNKESKDIIKEIIEYETKGKLVILNSDSLEDLTDICNKIYEFKQGDINAIYWD
ncbi:MAG: hypothetical protein Q4P31_05500 [Andreesenia angusta]|nr:hypothetical protein [Andreesenia angusta]